MAAMQTDKPQGDLIAWRPGATDLAYLAPSERSSWYTGALLLAKGPDYKVQLPLAPAILVTGDLTWSPSGDLLAFTAFRPNENVATVMVVRPDGSGLTDLFSTDAAHTDNRSSQKSILGWKDDTTLQVMISCGEECRTAFDLIVTGTAGQALVPTQVPNYHELANSLQVHRNTREYKTEQFPKNMNDPDSDPNWSPDGNMIAYLDKRGLLWLLFTEGKTNSLLDIGLREVAETQWSSDNRYLAIRAEDRIFVFIISCPK
jgi:dipeptidyl aminopeptidase/acylaminoacyl peptidase